MISLSNLFEDIQQQPPQQPGQPVQQQPMMNNTQQLNNQQNPGLWNKVKSGYNKVDSEYESFVDKAKDTLLFSTPARMLAGPVAGMIANYFSPGSWMMGNIAGSIVHNTLAQNRMANKQELARQQWLAQQQQMQQQPQQQNGQRPQ